MKLIHVEKELLHILLNDVHVTFIFCFFVLDLFFLTCSSHLFLSPYMVIVVPRLTCGMEFY